MQYTTKIMKFGGAAINQKKSLDNLINATKINEQERLICVISAFAKTTYKLKEAAKKSLNGNLSDALKEIELLKQFHTIFFSNGSSIKKITDELFSEIISLLRGISITRELTPATLDKVISSGEIIAGKIIEYQMASRNIKCVYIDSSELIITDDNFGNAKPLIDISAGNIKQKLKKLTDENFIVIVPGFIAGNRSGKRTTMGMESSNLTALILADVLNIKEITIRTDVDGIRSADPKLFGNTLPVPNLSYEQAELAAWCGLKLIYKDMIYFARKNQIKIIYKSLINPDTSHTEISEKKGSMQVLIINTNYTKTSKIQTKIMPDSPVFYDLNFVYSKNADYESDYSLITIINDDNYILQKIISYFQFEMDYEKIEFNSSAISIILKNNYLEEARNYLNNLIIGVYETNSKD